MNDGAVTTAERLLDLFQGARLTPTQRRIAHSLVQHAKSAAYLSAAEVAELAGVSQPSVTRFAMALGYAGYPALRRELRNLIGVGVTPSDTGDNPMQRALRSETQHLERMADELGSLETVHSAARLLAASHPLPVLGLRAAGPLAAYFGYFAAKVHPDVRVLDGGGTILLDRFDQCRAAGATALLAIVLPRYPRESLDVLREVPGIGGPHQPEPGPELLETDRQPVAADRAVVAADLADHRGTDSRAELDPADHPGGRAHRPGGQRRQRR